jgi:uncharacterized protein DUF6644
VNFSFLDALPTINAIAASRLGQAISTSTWAFAVIESIHLLALSVIGGAVLVVDLRLLGLGLRSQPAKDIARDAWPWFVASWMVMIVTGVLLFVSEPLKLYYSTPFFWKITFLVLATVFAVTVRRRVLRADEGRMQPLMMKLVGLTSLALWFGVGAGGRWIGFSG